MRETDRADLEGHPRFGLLGALETPGAQAPRTAFSISRCAVTPASFRNLRTAKLDLSSSIHSLLSPLGPNPRGETGVCDYPVATAVQSKTSTSTWAPVAKVTEPGGTTMNPSATLAVRVSAEHWLMSGRTTKPCSATRTCAYDA